MKAVRMIPEENSIFVFLYIFVFVVTGKCDNLTCRHTYLEEFEPEIPNFFFLSFWDCLRMILSWSEYEKVCNVPRHSAAAIFFPDPNIFFRTRSWVHLTGPTLLLNLIPSPTSMCRLSSWLKRYLFIIFSKYVIAKLLGVGFHYDYVDTLTWGEAKFLC